MTLTVICAAPHNTFNLAAKYMSRGRLSVEARKVLWLAAGVALASGLLMAIVLWNLRADAVTQSEKNAHAVAHIVQEQMDRTLQTVDLRMQLTINRLANIQRDAAPDSSAISAMLLEQTHGMPFVSNMAVLDARGRTQYHSAPGLVGTHLAERAFFQLYRTQPETRFALTTETSSRDDQKGAISVSLPIIDTDGAMTGFVVADLDSNYFEKVWAAVDLGPNGAIGFYRRDGVLVFRSPQADASVGKAFYGQPPFGRLNENRGDGEISYTSPIDGFYRNFAYRALKQYPAVVIVGVTYDAILGVWTRMAAMAIGFWSFALVGLALLSYRVAQGIETRLQSSQSLRKSDEQLVHALRGGDLGMWDWNVSNNQLTVNTRWLTMLGLDPLGPPPTLNDWHARVHPEDMPHLSQLQREVILNPAGTDFEVEVRARHALGHWIWILDKGAVVDRASDGSSLRVVGTHLDISRRRNAEESLRQSEYRWRFAIEGSGDGLWDWDLVNGVVFFSDRWKAMLGFESDDIGQTPDEWKARLHPDDRDRVLANIQAHLNGETKEYASEHRVVCKDGSVKWVMGRAFVVSRRADGHALRMIGTNADMTERKQAALALESSNAQLRLLETCVSRLNDIVVITEAEPFEDPGHRIVFVNDAFERRTGYAREEVIGKTPRILQGPKTQAEELRRMGAVMRRWEPVRAELINYTKSGEEYWIELEVVPISNASGLYTHWVAVERDITLRKQEQEALQLSLREKVVLLNEVHHRVKNNLQVVTSLLRLEARRSVLSETKTALVEMQGRIRSMALLHESLYRTGVFASVGLDTYLKQLCQQAFRASTNVGAVRLVLDMASVNVSLDQATPCGLLVNELFSNCLKHGFPDGRTGEIRLALQPAADSRWRLSVSDNGVGLPADFDTQRNGSLGLKLASDLALQLATKLEIGHGPGASFSVSFRPLES